MIASGKLHCLTSREFKLSAAGVWGAVTISVPPACPEEVGSADVPLARCAHVSMRAGIYIAIPHSCQWSCYGGRKGIRSYPCQRLCFDASAPGEGPILPWLFMSRKSPTRSNTHCHSCALESNSCACCAGVHSPTRWARGELRVRPGSPAQEQRLYTQAARPCEGRDWGMFAALSRLQLLRVAMTTASLSATECCCAATGSRS